MVYAIGPGPCIQFKAGHMLAPLEIKEIDFFSTFVSTKLNFLLWELKSEGSV